MVPKPVFLDVGSSSIEQKLRIAEESKEDEFNKLFGSHVASHVVPTAGFCVKSKELDTGVKVFINVCSTNDIPPPNDISEEELLLICTTEDVSSFKIPMSIGEILSETDKNGNAVKVSDVAVNPNFLKKIDESALFKNFFIAVAFEGLKNKHKLQVNKDRIVLKNRKSYGTIQVHRIRQSDDYAENRSEANVKNFLNDRQCNNGEINRKTKPKIETISSVTYDEKSCKQPEYRLFRKTGEKDYLYGEFKLLKTADATELTLDIGEDRIILESNDNEYYLDIFVPFSVKEKGVTATFNKTSKILTITMPIKL